MNQNVGDIGVVTVEQVEKALSDVVQGTGLLPIRVEAAKVLLEHFDRKARTVAGNTESES